MPPAAPPSPCTPRVSGAPTDHSSTCPPSAKPTAARPAARCRPSRSTRCRSGGNSRRHSDGCQARTRRGISDCFRFSTPLGTYPQAHVALLLLLLLFLLLLLE